LTYINRETRSNDFGASTLIVSWQEATLIDRAAPRSNSKPCNVRMVDLVMLVMKSEKQESSGSKFFRWLRGIVSLRDCDQCNALTT